MVERTRRPARENAPDPFLVQQCVDPSTVRHLADAQPGSTRGEVGIGVVEGDRERSVDDDALRTNSYGERAPVTVER